MSNKKMEAGSASAITGKMLSSREFGQVEKGAQAAEILPLTRVAIGGQNFRHCFDLIPALLQLVIGRPGPNEVL